MFQTELEERYYYTLEYLAGVRCECNNNSARLFKHPDKNIAVCASCLCRATLQPKPVKEAACAH